MTIVISTDGVAPALAGLLREALDDVLPRDLDAWMTCAREARRAWLENEVPVHERRPLLLRALVALYDARAATEAESALET